MLDYLDDMASALAAADLVVARAGATSIAEITALGLPSVLVPYPYATDDHQTKNAASLVAHGAAVLVADAELDGQRFGDVVAGLLGDAEARATMSAASRELGRPRAAADVAQLARSVACSTRGLTRSPLKTRRISLPDQVYAHFIGAGGAGISGIALVLAERGAVVTGSDLKESRYSRALEDGWRSRSHRSPRREPRHA